MSGGQLRPGPVSLPVDWKRQAPAPRTPSSSGGPAGVTLGPVGTWEPHTLSSPTGRSIDNRVWAQRQAAGRRALGKVGAAHPGPLSGTVGGASLPGGTLSSLTPRLPQPLRTRWPSCSRCSGTSRRPIGPAQPAHHPRSRAASWSCRREDAPQAVLRPAKCGETPAHSQRLVSVPLTGIQGLGPSWAGGARGPGAPDVQG